MKDEVVSYTLDPKNFSLAFLVIDNHAHYMNMSAIEIFTQYFNYSSNTQWVMALGKGAGLLNRPL